jgi:hypothetical protein
VVSVTDPYGRNLGFLDGSPVPDFSENLVAPGIEPGPLDLKPGNLTTPQRRSLLFITEQ